jgi:hypothetical protein
MRSGFIRTCFLLEEGFKLTIWRPNLTDQATDQATGQAEEGVKRVVLIIRGEMKRAEIQNLLELRHRETFLKNYLKPSIESGHIEMTLPDKPTSPKQRYRLTDTGIGRSAWYNDTCN